MWLIPDIQAVTSAVEVGTYTPRNQNLTTIIKLKNKAHTLSLNVAEAPYSPCASFLLYFVNQSGANPRLSNS
ncbi:hypothetical protein A1OQ_21630 [Enterovibrio norvegicus FF-162]|nr:hypothetical protein A1OQ_21630 [Enterovibrio norvegicus FF-162]